jgi:hypothetical protein
VAGLAVCVDLVVFACVDFWLLEPEAFRLPSVRFDNSFIPAGFCLVDFRPDGFCPDAFGLPSVRFDNSFIPAGFCLVDFRPDGFCPDAFGLFTDFLDELSLVDFCLDNFCPDDFALDDSALDDLVVARFLLLTFCDFLTPFCATAMS